jgi:hypothetical protein
MTDLEKKEKRKIYYLKNKEKFKIYAQENKEKISVNQKIYRKNNKEYQKNWNENNIDKIKIIKKKGYLKNKEKNKQYAKEYYNKNKEKISEKMKIYNIDNIQKIKQRQKKYLKKRREIDTIFKLRCNIGGLIRNSLKNKNYTKHSKTFEILGCRYQDFKQHLERQFTKGMSWENQGEWHLDHIYPVSLAKDEAELIKLNHYTNFQPMWASENISKGNKIIPNTQIKLI